MTGNFQTYTEAANDPVGFFRFSQYEGFGQDSWRIPEEFQYRSRDCAIAITFRLTRSRITCPTSCRRSTIRPPPVKETAPGTDLPGSGNPYDGLGNGGQWDPRQPGRTSSQLQ